ncbi:DUF992 domain-containing protein [Chelativorans sp. AA-79]|uniref:DUF992 domain-containing protein n=1 Tax=Chelativorans sp. AA-79 TaxID=3028735 RepID=UPI0023F9E182|nr:DUF992 domain-containing protein [Chelativorans sp. AA-79]WEX10209.1 DUF992 domain-containing protein [Chelativorans sp. AA-79]
MHRSAIAALGAIFALSTTAMPAAAQQRTEVGMLDCIIEGGTDIGFVTSKELSCTFQPADSSRPPETYVGAVKKFGLEIGSTSERVMRWAVLAPTTADPYAPGALADTYVGPSAEVTAGIGGGANVLVSRTNRNLVLQPISLQAQTGLNIAVGVDEFVLRSTAQ